MVTGARDGQTDTEQYESTDNSPHTEPRADLSLLPPVPAEDLRSMGFPDPDVPVTPTTTHTNGEPQDPDPSQYGVADMLEIEWEEFDVYEALVSLPKGAYLPSWSSLADSSGRRW